MRKNIKTNISSFRTRRQTTPDNLKSNKHGRLWSMCTISWIDSNPSVLTLIWFSCSSFCLCQNHPTKKKRSGKKRWRWKDVLFIDWHCSSVSSPETSRSAWYSDVLLSKTFIDEIFFCSSSFADSFCVDHVCSVLDHSIRKVRWRLSNEWSLKLRLEQEMFSRQFFPSIHHNKSH